MKLSVIVSTLNDRESLVSCLDALADRTPSSTEVIVVNGPSSDGTSGCVRDREDVDVLVEISERNPNVSRNAGLEAVTGSSVGFLTSEYLVEPGWYDAIENALSGGHVVTGPVTDDTELSVPRSRPILDRTVPPLNAGNVAFDASVLERLDGFDEYLSTDGTLDCAHRVKSLGYDLAWSSNMAVRSEVGTDGGRPEPAWGEKYRALSYRLTKNHGPRPTILGRIGYCAVCDGIVGIRSIFSGKTTPTDWFDNGLSVTKNGVRGLVDGVRARYADRTKRRNPNGVSVRHDRAVQLYDRRSEE